jgi:mannosyltransferase OCH1-like enzyme
MIATNRYLKKGKIRSIVPKIAHFVFEPIYLDSIPNSWATNLQNFKTFHPEYTIMNWNLKTALDMIRTNYDIKYGELIQSFKNSILALDTIRYFILHQYGGIYIDYDIEWYAKLPLLLHNYNTVLVRETDFRIKGQINNCFMMSVKGCKFFRDCFEKICNSPQKDPTMFNTLDYVLYRTGPCLVTQIFLNKCKNQSKYQDWTQVQPYFENELNLLILPHKYYAGFNKDIDKPSTFYHTMDGSWISKEDPLKGSSKGSSKEGSSKEGSSKESLNHSTYHISHAMHKYTTNEKIY